MTSERDVVVLGSGPNELVAACYLAKAGQRVTVVEAKDELGGAARALDIPGAPGFRLPVAPPSAGWLAPKVVSDLGLAAQGFEEVLPAASVVTARPGQAPLVLWTDMAKSREEIRKHSSVDAEKWGPFSTRMATLAGFLQTLYSEEPPRLLSEHAGDLFSLMAVGLRLRRLGKIDMVELLRTLPMSVQDLLDDWFESDLLKGTLGAGGITNILQGPRSAGTCFVMLHHLVGRPLGGFRGRRVVTSERGHLHGALVRRAKELGVELRTKAGAGMKVLVDDGRAVGVGLGSAEELHARYVVSGADPRTTFLDLVDPTELSPEFVRAVQSVKLRGARAVVNLALGERPELTGVPADALDGVISLGPNLDYLERAYDDAKHGRISKNLFLEATIPSIRDPSLAPAGKHVMSVAVQYVPYHLKEGTWDEATKSALADRVIATLGEVAPNLAAAVVGSPGVYGPKDIEQAFGLVEGNLYGGELTLDQILFMRPIPGFAHYRTPIDGLFMCGDACHPGGGLPGLAGANAAREIAKDL